VRKVVVRGAVIAVAVLGARFFYGRFLQPGDFTGEQQYTRCRRRLR
jgi:hypothetical protein